MRNRMRLPRFTNIRQALLLVTMLLLVLGAERSYEVNSDGEIPDISTRINAFTLALLKQQAGANNPAANAILSPQSIFHGLAMTYIASGGDTRRELAEALGFPDDNEQLLRDLARLRRQLQAAAQHKRMEVRVANSAWLDETYADFRKDYVNEVQDTFAGSLQHAQFRQAERASSEINRWISERTRGRIAKSVAPSDFQSRSGAGIIEEPALVLVNAVYFKADWGSQFDKESTQQRAFHVDTTTTAEAMMMHQCSLLPYAENDRFKFLEIPYIGRHYSMYIVLPREIIPIAKLVDGVTMEEIISLKRSASPHQVDVLLPKFEMKSHLGVKDALSAMGVRSAFEKQQADFDRMIVKKTEAFRVYLSEIYHEVWTDVHEEGTEAAAVTTTSHYSIGCGAPSASVPPPAQFHADHPFLFLVVHNASRSVLFAGWISNPGPREPIAVTGQKEGALSEAVLRRVADAYYRGIATSSEEEREQEAGDKARRAPASATGRVVDRRGVPIAGAEVVPRGGHWLCYVEEES